MATKSLSSTFVDRLVQLQDFIDAKEYEKIIFDCQSLLNNYNRILVDDEHDDDQDNVGIGERGEQGDLLHGLPDELRCLLLELWAKSHFKLGQWQQVIDFNLKDASVADSNSLARKTIRPLQAYAYYRLGNYAMAKEMCLGGNQRLDNHDDDDDPLLRHTLAQSLYRLHETDNARNEYQKLALSLSNPQQQQQQQQQHDEEEMMQTLTNALAVCISNAPIVVPNVTDNNDDEFIVQQSEALLEKTGDLYYDLNYNLGTWQVLQNSNNNNNNNVADPGWTKLLAAERAIQDQFANEPQHVLEKELLPVQINIKWAMQLRRQGGENQQQQQQHVHYTGDDFFSKLNSNKPLAHKDLPVNVTPLQKRLYHYNQAILGLKSNQYPLVKLNCTMLLKSFQKNNKKNGNKSHHHDDDDDDDEEWWKSRVQVLEARALDQQGKRAEGQKLLRQALAALQSSSSSTATSSMSDAMSNNSNSNTIDLAIAWIQLHLAQLEGKLDSPQHRLECLESLPTRIVQSRAVVATRAALYQKLGQSFPEGLLLEQDAADLLLLQEKYQEAAPYFAKQNDGRTGEDVTNRVKYVLCLSHTDPLQAIQVWKDLGIDDIDNGDDTTMTATTKLSGEELEQMPLPLIKTARNSAALSIVPGVTSKSRKSHDSILKRRAKLRERYLASLDQQQQEQRVIGSTTAPAVASHVTARRPPNPDRWIPKYERSKNRRRGQHKGAQGGFTEKDAAKYDVAARNAAAAAQGYNNSSTSGKHSTAHIAAVAGDGVRRGGGGGRRR